MRKLLVASQKSSSGKTTTSINLAAATAMKGSRVLLVDVDPVGTVSMALNLTSHKQREKIQDMFGMPLHGDVCRDVVAGLDVVSPYDEGIGSEEDLQKLMNLLGSDAVKNHYSCVVLNAPPFMGERPKELLKACDELILVLRAEPLAFRTLPMFLDMLKAIDEEDNVGLRGILLTLPEAGRWESDLRRYLGKKVFEQVIPNDPEVPRAESKGVAVTVAHPDSPASVQFLAMSNALDLGRDVPLPEYARNHRPVFNTAPARTPVLSGSGSTIPAAKSRGSSGSGYTTPSVPADDSSVVRPAARLRGVAQIPAQSGTSGSQRGSLHSRRALVARENVAAAEKAAAPVPPVPVTPPAKPAAMKPTEPAKFNIRPWHLAIGSGLLFGLLLGIMRVPEQFLPIGVGLATAGIMVLVLRLMMTVETDHRKAASSSHPTGSGSAPNVRH